MGKKVIVGVQGSLGLVHGGYLRYSTHEIEERAKFYAGDDPKPDN